jgi:cyanophycinase
MVTGGESWDALRYGPTTDQDPPGRYDLTYLPRGGFGLFVSGLIDTHFGARGRQGRIVRLAAAVGATRAYGIDENTALVVTGDSQRVLGSGGVHVLDLRAAVTGTRNGYWSIGNVRWTYLTRGDTYRPSSWTMSTTKAAYRPATGYAPGPPSDVFSSPRAADPDANRLTVLALDLVRAGRDTGAYGESYETGPVYEVNLTEDGPFAAYRSGSAISFAQMRADIRVY